MEYLSFPNLNRIGNIEQQETATYTGGGASIQKRSHIGKGILRESLKALKL